MGTNALFTRLAGNGHLNEKQDGKCFDVVLSMMVVCHVSAILQYLALLGNLAAKAIFIWAHEVDDDDYRIVFEEPKK